MIIRFIGLTDRVNSFGEFKTKKGGRLYDVSDEVGKELLTISTLFEPKSGPIEKTDAKHRIVEVDEDDVPVTISSVVMTDSEGNDPEKKIEPKTAADYMKLTAKQMENECRERGMTLERGSRKSTMVEALVEDDAKPKDDRTIEQKLKEEFEKE